MFTTPTTFLGHNAGGGGGGGGSATVFPSRDAYAVFDGVDDNVIIPHSTALKPSTTVSVSYWFRRPTSGKVQFGAYNNTAVANSDYVLQIWSNGTIYAYIYSGASSTYYYGGSMPVDQWTHITMVYDGGQSGNSNRLKIYVNGNLLTGSYSGTIPASLNQGTEDLSFKLGTNFTSGSIRDARIYNDALTADEITYVYSEGTSGTDPTNTNLVGHWEFDDGEGGLIADSSGNGNDGQAHNITEPAFWDKYATFDGVDDYVTIPLDVDLSTAGSIAFWVNPESLNNNDGVFGYDPPTPTNSEMWLYLMANGEARYRQINSSGTTRGFTTSASDFSVGTWAHVVISRSGHDTAVMYLDGVDTGNTITSGAGTVPSAGDLRLGTGYSTLYMNAKMRDFRIYDDALTADEVTYIYTAGESGTDPGTANLVDRCLLNDGEGSVVVDSSGNGNDGQAKNITEPLFWSQPHADFDGSNDYVDVGDLGITSSEVSVSMWLNTDVNAASAVYRVFNNYDFSGPAQYIMIGINTSGNASQKFQFSVDNGTSHVTAFSNSTVTTGTWYHIVGIYNSSTNEVSIWVDGTKQTATGTIIGSDPAFNQYHYTIGKNEASAQYYWDGKVRDARIYNDALTADEVLYLATAGEQGTDPGTANRIGRWKLGDRWGTNVDDTGSGDNDGTATNITESTFWVQ